MSVQLVLERASAALGRPLGEAADTSSTDAMQAALRRAVELLSERLRSSTGSGQKKVAACASALVEATALLDELSQRKLGERLDALARVQEGLGRLRGVASLEQMLHRATEEVCRACGFDRCILFRVDGSHLMAESAHFVGHEAEAREMVAIARRERPALTHMLLETELLRRRQAALVEDPINDARTFKPLIMATDTRAYVAAPIMPEGRVIGFLHADCRYSERRMDELDRDVLWVFAEGFGYAVERTVLLERLRSQREHVRTLVASTAAIMDELTDTEVELGASDGGASIVARTAASVFVAPESRIDALLTKREREVLALMASGARNSEIADRLVISEATVKSHVKHILRKLRAANRAEAVSRFLRISGNQQRATPGPQ